MSERWAFAAAKTNATRKAPRNLVEEASHMPAFRNDAGRLSLSAPPPGEPPDYQVKHS